MVCARPTINVRRPQPALPCLARAHTTARLRILASLTLGFGREREKPVISEAQNPNSGRRPEFAKFFGSEAPKKGKNGPMGRGGTGAGRVFVTWGPSRARPEALKGATGRIGKIPTYVKRSRALKSARSFSPKFRAGRRRVSPTPSPTSTNPLNVYLTRPGAPAPPLEPFWGVRISEHPKSRTCIEKPVSFASSPRDNIYH